MKKIIIETSKESDNLFDVTLEEENKESKLADSLTYEEMLGLISSVNMPIERPCLQWLKTDEQIKQYRDYMDNIKNDSENRSEGC